MIWWMCYGTWKRAIDVHQWPNQELRPKQRVLHFGSYLNCAFAALTMSLAQSSLAQPRPLREATAKVRRPSNPI